MNLVCSFSPRAISLTVRFLLFFVCFCLFVFVFVVCFLFVVDWFVGFLLLFLFLFFSHPNGSLSSRLKSLLIGAIFNTDRVILPLTRPLRVMGQSRFLQKYNFYSLLSNVLFVAAIVGAVPLEGSGGWGGSHFHQLFADSLLFVLPP